MPREVGGLYRSDDAGETLDSASTTTTALVGTAAATSPRCKVDPKNPDIVYIASIVTWKSTDGGKTFAALRGAPGGDDYHRIWINPNNPNIILIASDQGAIDHRQRRRRPGAPGTTSRPRSSITSAPTTRFRIASAAASRRAARRACRAAATTAGSRSANGIRSASRSTATSRPIRSIPTSSTAARSRATTAAPAQVADVGADAAARRRTIASCAPRPSLFSPVDPHMLLLRVEHAVEDDERRQRAGRRSVPTSRARPGACRRASACIAARRRAAVAARRRSTRSRRRRSTSNRIWAGTDDGLIHVDGDGGKNWNDVTPPELDAVGKVSIIDAAHFDALDAPTPRSTRSASTICVRTSIARTTAARRGQQIISGIPDGATDQRRPRGSEAQGPALRRHARRRSMSRSTTAITGSRCG